MTPSLLQALGVALLTLIPLILSLSVHECAHALAARQMGDDTAQRAGRLTLNPIAHADLVGTVLLPLGIMMVSSLGAQSALSILPLIGWARPTPVNVNRFRRPIGPRRGMLWVAGAGPLSNLLLALACAAALVWGVRAEMLDMRGPAVQFLATMLTLNVGLCVFNLLPIAPLDGQKVVANLLSPGAQMAFERFSLRFGTPLLLGLVLLCRAPLSAVVMAVRGALLTAVDLA